MCFLTYLKHRKMLTIRISVYIKLTYEVACADVVFFLECGNEKREQEKMQYD